MRLEQSEMLKSQGLKLLLVVTWQSERDIFLLFNTSPIPLPAKLDGSWKVTNSIWFKKVKMTRQMFLQSLM